MSQVTARGDSKIETTTAPDGSDKKVSDLGDWGTLEVKTFGYHVDSKSDELFKIPGGVITRAPGCFAEAGVNKVTQLRAYTNAYAVNVLLDEKTHPPDPQTEEASEVQCGQQRDRNCSCNAHGNAPLECYGHW
jgi:hypothetical protein